MSSSRIPPHATRVFTGEIFDVYQWQQPLFDGSTATFEMLRRPDTAIVIPIVGDRILITEERQPNKPAPFLSLPGGRFEPGDTPESAARRELCEETGYEPSELELWQTIRPVGKIDWHIHVFIGRDCRPTGVRDLDAGEDITTSLVSFEEFLHLTEKPAFGISELFPALLRLQLHADEREAFRNLLFRDTPTAP